MKKNKMKVRKSVSRRFKITKTGKVMFSHQNVGHRKTHKNKRQIRRNNEPGQLSPHFSNKVKKMLNNK